MFRQVPAFELIVNPGLVDLLLVIRKGQEVETAGGSYPVLPTEPTCAQIAFSWRCCVLPRHDKCWTSRWGPAVLALLPYLKGLGSFMPPFFFSCSVTEVLIDSQEDVSIYRSEAHLDLLCSSFIYWIIRQSAAEILERDLGVEGR